MMSARRVSSPLRRGPGVLAGDACLLFLLVSGVLFCFLSAFSVETAPRLLLAACVVYTLLALLVWSLPRRWWLLPLLILGALWGVLVWRNWPLLVLGEVRMRCDVINTFVLQLEVGGTIRPVVELPPWAWPRCVTLLLQLALFPIGMLLGLFLVRLRSFALCFWVSVPFLLVPVCLSITPDWLPLMALLLVWLVLGLSSLAARHDRQGAARLHLIALPAAALLLAVLTLAMPQQSYQRPAWADRANAAITQWATELDGPFQGNGILGGRSDGLANPDGTVSLSSAGPLDFSGRTVLDVRTSLRGRIYLRGFSCAVYDSDGWGPLSEETYHQLHWENDDLDYWASSVYRPSLDGWQPLNFPALADRENSPGKEYAKVIVRNVGTSGSYIYCPYQILTQPEELSSAQFVYDYCLAPTEKDVPTYTLYVQPDCSPDSGARLPSETVGAEARYRDFVSEYYTDIPAQALPAVEQAVYELMNQLNDASLHGTDNPSYQDYLDFAPASVLTQEQYDRQLPLLLAEVTAAYLDDLAEYDPDTPVTPADQDFISYFLSESHRGYCMHFASAATLMLRYLGIPARYVSGYVADVPASGRVNVPDSAAHAWVEIYINGYGWEPVEVTPAYAGSTPGQSGTQLEAEPTPTPTPTPAATHTPQTVQPTPSAAPDASEETPTDLRPLLAILAAAVLVLALPLRRALAHRAREKRFRDSNPNRAVIAGYRYLLRLERWGASMSPQTEELAKKAKFSPHTLTEEERQAVLSDVQSAAAAVSKASPWYRRLLLRYLLALL